MRKWALIVLLIPSLAWAQQDNFELYRSLFQPTETVITTESADPQLTQQASTLNGDADASQNGENDCFEVPDVLTQPARDLIADMEAIVTDEMMEEVDAPQSVVNKAIAKSKELVCAEIELFKKAHNLELQVDCSKRPQVIPPVHLQVVKFPGMAQKKAELAALIKDLAAKIEADPNDVASQSLWNRRVKDYNCLLQADLADYNCRYYLESTFNRANPALSIEVKDKNGNWYEFKQMPVNYFSGLPGPKTREGDRQVPEARYRLTSVNPASSYFSAVHVDYENWSQRNQLLGDLNEPGVAKGGQIKMHGYGGSVGCLDMGNRASPWLSALVDLSLKRGRVPEIDIYPTDMDEGLEEVASWPAYERYGDFWREVKDRYWNEHGARVNRTLPRVDQMLRKPANEN